MAQYRQSGVDNRLGGIRSYDLHSNNNGDEGTSSSSGHVSIGIRASSSQTYNKQSRPRRSSLKDNNNRRISFGALVPVFSFALFLFVFFAFFYVSDTDTTGNNGQDENSKTDLDFLTNVTRTDRLKVLEFGKGSIKHGGDSRYWDRDDRRRDEDYNENDVSQQHTTNDAREGSTSKNIVLLNKMEESYSANDSDKRGVGLYNEAGRKELRIYEAEYEASLKNGMSIRTVENHNQISHNAYVNLQHDADDEYGDGIDLHDARMEDDNNIKHDYNEAESYNVDGSQSHYLDAKSKGWTFPKDDEEATNGSTVPSLNFLSPDKVNTNLRYFGAIGNQSIRRGDIEKRPESKKKTKRRKFFGCEMKLLNSTAQLVEPIESPKFARFSLQYVAVEEHADEQVRLEPTFAGYQSLQEREESFLAHDKKINCGFVKGPEGSPSTGFDLAEDDARYLSSCHIAVVSCIFGNSDRLRTPMGKTVSRLSRKNVCFVMFIDKSTLQSLTSEGQTLDSMSSIGIWKIVVVINLPYSDMRRVGKVPKFLSHRLFPKARYSIWLDSKLRLQLDPLLILEYLLWRKGYEYAISNHYDRHCVWEEVAQNKKLNKYNHTVIDQQFAFYQRDGLKRFDPSDHRKLLPSNVPEGSFIVRAHTPMSNLFSCLWFNEVERFTPRDQLSFAYTYQKFRKMNPGKPFRLNMFKDCERRAVAKLFRHRSEEKRIQLGAESKG